MQLRNGTTVGAKTVGKNSNKKNKKFEKTLRQHLDDQAKNPVSSGNMDNLIYTLRLYETMAETFVDYNDDNVDSHDRFVITAFVKTIQLMSTLTDYTYKTASLEYTDYTKGLIVKTMYKLHEVFVTLRYMLSQKEHDSDYISGLLQISIDENGEKIFNKNSIEAKAYYCYRHFYKSQEENSYDISSYADGVYTEVEIYDYYFKGNPSKDVKDDVLINQDYKKWFENEETTDRYDNLAYNSVTTEQLPSLFTMCELERRINFHKNELEKYEHMMRESH